MEMTIKTEAALDLVFTGAVLELDPEQGPLAEFRVTDANPHLDRIKGATGFLGEDAWNTRLTDRKAAGLPYEQSEAALEAIRNFSPK
jgi:hypothetical protein